MFRKRVVSVLLVLIMVFGMVPLTAVADDITYYEYKEVLGFSDGVAVIYDSEYSEEPNKKTMLVDVSGQIIATIDG